MVVANDLHVEGKGQEGLCPLKLGTMRGPHPLLRAIVASSIFISLIASSPHSHALGGCGWDTKDGWVARENAKAGNPTWDTGLPVRMSADFSRRNPGSSRIEGWFGSTSARCGQTVALHLVGLRDEAKISIYRMGYYKGAGARFISSARVKNPLWKYTISNQTPPGQYLFRLDQAKSVSAFVPLIIRDENSKSNITFISSVLTWQSYNQWGGSSLYKGPNAKRETQAKEVSFDRPYDGDGAGQFRYLEFPATQLAEKNGIAINYITDIDLDSDPTVLRSTQSIVVGGHSEYWTERMRGAIETSVNRGINLVSLGANTGYNRTILSQNSRAMGKIVKWRDPTIKKPESLLFGSQYFALGVHEDYVVTNAQVWPFNVLKQGQRIKGIAGNEVDSALNAKGPAIEVLAKSSNEAMATYYTLPSGSGILNMGTIGWVCAIGNICPWGHKFALRTRNEIRLVTEEIFTGLTKGPLGHWRLATPDIPARL
ncbi:unannotated protein [freshwater metagenome]|uniref:Unannotated protein n=1 Tax=freshwater metagenome TaxID=449393 RepID=A0A6J7XSF1_9ZZZZ